MSQQVWRSATYMAIFFFIRKIINVENPTEPLSSSLCLPSSDFCIDWILLVKDSDPCTSSYIQSRFHLADIWTLAYYVPRPKIITC